MNFVIVAPNFYPLSDAEAYCSTRFASALAKLGHTVEVITAWRPEEMYEKSYPQLVHPNLKITRVGPCVRAATKWPHIDWKWLTVMEPDADLISPYVEATRAALARYENPILVSRSYPWLSFYVGWYCRKQAARWIAHFSDPMLDFKPFCRLAYLKMWSLKWWMRRAMRHADAISVTCKRVRWYYREQLGSCVDKAKFILTTHIGDFKLEKKVEKVGGGGGERRGGEKRWTVDGKISSEKSLATDILSEKSTHHCPPPPLLSISGTAPRFIYHDGDIYAGRGLLMVEAVDKLNAEGFKCIFLQGRDVKRDEDRKRLLASPNCKIVGKDAPQELKELAKTAQVSFVADFDTPGLSYSPFLMSKFVYQLFNDKPMVVLSKLESEKHDYCIAYPEAGLFFAEIGKVDTLVSAIKSAFICETWRFDRGRIRDAFAEETIGLHFLNEIGG